jgi:outer membrane protein assembly factor BamB
MAAGAALLSVALGILAAGAGSAAIAAGSTGLSCETSSGTWPMYQADPTHSADACSSITTSNASTLLPSWFVPTKGEVTATPAVVNGTLYVGDSTGAFYALNASTGAQEWTFSTTSPQSCFVDQTNPFATEHPGGFGDITSSAAVTTVNGTPTVYVGAGGSVFALNATTGQCLWAQDTDPANPTSAIEVESSPVVDTAVSPPEVLVGNDDNGVYGLAVTGLMAFNAETGALLWKYEPERDATLYPSEFGGSDALTLSCGDGAANADCTPANVPNIAPNSATYADACGDVWASPTLDTSFTDPAGDNTFEGSGTAPAGWTATQITASGQASADGLAVFGIGNCAANPDPATAEAHGDYEYNQGVFALDPVTGVRVWSFIQPYNIYDTGPSEPLGGDDDFGGSAILAQVPSANVTSTACAGSGGNTSLVIEGVKDGYAYGLCEATGAVVWSNQISQPGQLTPLVIGAVGGFIGSPSLGEDNGKATVFFDSAIPLPFSSDGFQNPTTGISACPEAVLSDLPLLPVCPDLSLAASPSRLIPLSAVDAATGTVDWRAASVPTYAATSYTNGVVFAPQSLGLSIVAYNASTGAPLWTLPLGAAPSSAAAIAGDMVYVGAGTSFETLEGVSVPPQATGIWAFKPLL